MEFTNLVILFSQSFWINFWCVANQFFQGKPWWNCIVPNAWTSTHRNRHGIIIQTAHTLEQDSHTCCSWYTRSTGQNDQQTSLYQGEKHLNNKSIHYINQGYLFGKRGIFTHSPLLWVLFPLSIPLSCFKSYLTCLISVYLKLVTAATSLFNN